MGRNHEPAGHYQSELEFGVSCDVSDQSGTLPRVWISHSVVKEMLGGMTPLEFLSCPETLKTQVLLAGHIDEWRLWYLFQSMLCESD